MEQPDLLAATTPIVEALEALGVPYHIGGSVNYLRRWAARLDLTSLLQRALDEAEKT